MEPNEDLKNQVFRDNLQNVAAGSSSSITDFIDQIQNPIPIKLNKLVPESVRPPRPIKWKNAFGFVYQVRRRLGSQPKLYNEFIEIMRRVHSRTIETPDVVNIISHLFKDHPDLVNGFNMFLPERHRVYVKVPTRVSVCGNPSPDTSSDSTQKEELSITTRIIRFTLNVRKRFEDDEKCPDKYKRFLEVLYLYKALSQQLQGLRKCRNVLKEEDVYAEVDKLFENNEDLLQEFSEYLPYNKNLSSIYKNTNTYYNDNTPYNCTCCSNVSSSSQSEVKEALEMNLPIDEVTSSDDSRLSEFCQNSQSKDISSSIKSEFTDKYIDESNFIVSDDRADIDNLLSAVPEKVFTADECFDKQAVYRDENEDDTQIMNSTTDIKKINSIDKENFIKFEDKFEYSIDDDYDRALRKPLTPFKMPNLPNKIQEPEKIIEEFPKGSDRLVTERPLSPISETGSSVIIRLAKRVQLGSTTDDEFTEISTPRQSETNSSPPKPTSNKRLKNLRKRLRRLANI